ncbi:histone deacetylase [Coprinopsis cinerea okayama7|uniref:Histone deacetylase n=1 Tax=Coprinopsis cinerea (strain Okayama-7 / 130 / ATCC MYA-4618 / FGSC 9003) TaxID=240176 RepID=A8NA31_COPC7|nr:histone deacetylase [Coprinopsis cinerea okayama7\|eukprot:XP_001831687.2 histone deacetylase [Coprinopsis cinerea okayama7\
MSSKPTPPATVAEQEETTTFNISKQELLGLQIQALLDASDDVDLTPEVAQELLSCLQSADDGDSANEDGVVDPVADDEPPQESQEEVPEEPYVDIVTRNGEVDIWSIFDPFDKAEDSWTRQEIRQILHHLKERGASSFVAEYVIKRAIPITRLLNAFGFDLLPEILNKSAQTLLYTLQVAMSFHLRKREKLQQYNSIADAVQLIRNSERILILTGAGISVSCGIPDFRSRDGLYATLKERGEYDMDDPQQIFIKAVEDHGKNYTQNIDTLETLVGVERVLQCHGSFATASCLMCKRQVPGKDIEKEIMSQQVPLCPVCNAPEQQPPCPPPPPKKKKPKKGKKEWEESDSDDDRPPPPQYPPGLMKPDITFFGEKLNDSFDRALAEDRDKVDLLLVIGTSLKVAPVADILCNADEIIVYLADELGWDLPPPVAQEANEGRPQLKRSRGSFKRRLSTDSRILKMPERVGGSHIWLFDGAEGGKWLQEMRQTFGEVETRQSQSQASSRRPSPTGSQASDTRAPKKRRV